MTIEVEYVPRGHPPITKVFDVDSGDYKSAVATGKATVTYLPEDPRISRVTKFAMLPFQLIIGLGCIMLLAGFSCLAHALWTRSQT